MRAFRAERGVLGESLGLRSRDEWLEFVPPALPLRLLPSSSLWYPPGLVGAPPPPPPRWRKDSMSRDICEPKALAMAERSGRLPPAPGGAGRCLPATSWRVACTRGGRHGGEHERAGVVAAAAAAAAAAAVAAAVAAVGQVGEVEGGGSQRACTR